MYRPLSHAGTKPPSSANFASCNMLPHVGAICTCSQLFLCRSREFAMSRGSRMKLITLERQSQHFWIFMCEKCYLGSFSALIVVVWVVNVLLLIFWGRLLDVQCLHKVKFALIKNVLFRADKSSKNKTYIFWNPNFRQHVITVPRMSSSVGQKT